MPDFQSLRPLVEAAFADRALLQTETHRLAVFDTIEALDKGELRVAEPTDAGWQTHAWVKQAVLLYFGLRKMELIEVGPFEFHDKIPLKKELDKAGVRVVPPATVRYGAFLEAGAIVMPGYVNIGARVGAGSMVDTWATVGSCAQIGRDVHLAGGVGIGGVLEPPSARPVIIEDGVFVGSRCVIVEGVLVEKEAVIGAGVVLTANTPIIDVSGSEPVEHRGRVPARSVVIPGVRNKRFAAGEFGVPCALIIGKRSESTDRKVSLNDALRDFGVPVLSSHRLVMTEPAPSGSKTRSWLPALLIVGVTAGVALFGQAKGGLTPEGPTTPLPTARFTVGKGDAAFSIDATETTVAAYAACVAAGACEPAGLGARCNGGVADRAKHPINCVLFNDAMSFCAWTGGRLPTEEEWKLAAGEKPFPWGSDAPSGRACWSGGDPEDGTCPVGSFPTGAARGGLYDLAGNVWEWVEDASCKGEPACASTRMSLGGAWTSKDAPQLQVSSRRLDPPNKRASDIGFRCVRTPTPAP